MRAVQIPACQRLALASNDLGCRFLPNFTDGYKIVFVDNEDFLKELEQK